MAIHYQLPVGVRLAPHVAKLVSSDRLASPWVVQSLSAHLHRHALSYSYGRIHAYL